MFLIYISTKMRAENDSAQRFCNRDVVGLNFYDLQTPNQETFYIHNAAKKKMKCISKNMLPLHRHLCLFLALIDNLELLSYTQSSITTLLLSGCCVFNLFFHQLLALMVIQGFRLILSAWSCCATGCTSINTLQFLWYIP